MYNYVMANVSTVQYNSFNIHCLKGKCQSKLSGKQIEFVFSNMQHSDQHTTQTSVPFTSVTQSWVMSLRMSQDFPPVSNAVCPSHVSASTRPVYVRAVEAAVCSLEMPLNDLAFSDSHSCKVNQKQLVEVRLQQ
jgi:hypothetical protein